MSNFVLGRQFALLDYWYFSTFSYSNHFVKVVKFMINLYKIIALLNLKENE